MKHAQSDKYTIAWFKIAECVSRGEKERALGVYRLLSHSFNDNAVARQLEADIYFSFNERGAAIPLYRQAMELYQKSKRFLEAAAVGEHLLVLQPNDIFLINDVVNCYKMLDLPDKLIHHFNAMMAMYVVRNEWDNVQKTIDWCAHVTNPLHAYLLYKQLIIAIHSIHEKSSLTIACIEKAIDILLTHDHEDHLQDFLLLLSTINEQLYDYAVMYVKKN